MASHGVRDRVAIIGMGCTNFGERWDRSADDLVVDAVTEAISGTPGSCCCISLMAARLCGWCSGARGT